jgi:polysaccharide biosynthesis protein PslJ
MRTLAGSPEQGSLVSLGVVVCSLAILTLTVLTNRPLEEISVGVAVVVIAAIAYRHILSWPSLVVALLLVILFIPIRRYTLPGDLPFELEPYRLLVAFLILGWGSSLLIDPRVRLRKSGFEGPLVLFIIGILASELTNPGRVASNSTDVAKAMTFFFSFIVVFYLIVSVARSERHLIRFVKILVSGGALISVLAVIESRTGHNLFNDLGKVIPFLENANIPRPQGRGARLRSYASAQHAIALGALLVMLIPLAVYLGRKTRQRLWWLALGLLTVGALSTVSRTGVVMLLVVCVVFLWLRTAETKRFWPAVVPLLVVVHFALPATLGPLKNSFFPEGGLINEQRASAGTYGSGRIADLGPSLHEAKRTLVFGQGYGTRITEWGRSNAPILDNQWLGILLETGLTGLFGLLWLFVRAVRRFGRAAKEDDSARGWLFVALTAGIAAYGVGMFTYDAFAFIQSTLILFVLLAFGSVLLSTHEADARAQASSSAGPLAHGRAI